MRRTIFCALLLILTAVPAPADDYPRNHDIDILHYTFKIFLNEDTNNIRGETFIEIRFIKSGVDVFALDLIGKTDAADDTGMVVLNVSSGDFRLKFDHRDNRLKIYLDRPSKENERLAFRIDYRGTPGDGLIISQNKFGDRTFFADNWPNRARYWP